MKKFLSRHNAEKCNCNETRIVKFVQLKCGHWIWYKDEITGNRSNSNEININSSTSHNLCMLPTTLAKPPSSTSKIIYDFVRDDEKVDDYAQLLRKTTSEV